MSFVCGATFKGMTSRFIDNFVTSQNQSLREERCVQLARSRNSEIFRAVPRLQMIRRREIVFIQTMRPRERTLLQERPLEDSVRHENE